MHFACDACALRRSWASSCRFGLTLVWDLPFLHLVGDLAFEGSALLGIGFSKSVRLCPSEVRSASTLCRRRKGFYGSGASRQSPRPRKCLNAAQLALLDTKPSPKLFYKVVMATMCPCRVARAP